MTSTRALLPIPIATALAGVLALAGCTTPAQSGWSLTPVSIEAGSSASATDTFLPLELTSDTRGGFWGESEGVWIHVNAAGVTTESLPGATIGDGWRLSGATALSPTRILVSTVWIDGEHFGEILLVDTATSQQRSILKRDRGIGDVATAGGVIYFTEYEAGTAIFSVRGLELASGNMWDVASVDGDGALASIDADEKSNVYVATESARTVMDNSGTVITSESRVARNPGVAVSPGGSVIWIDDSTPNQTPSFWVSDGSRAARAIIDEHTDCAYSNLTVRSEWGEATIDFLCEPSGVAWLSDEKFAVSIGDEGGAPLVEVVPSW